MIRILTLVENQTGARKGLEAEHGLSFVVDADGVRILFDCGAGRAAAKNCRLLNVACRPGGGEKLQAAERSPCLCGRDGSQPQSL